MSMKVKISAYCKVLVVKCGEENATYSYVIPTDLMTC